MPIYEYRCRKGHTFEVMQSMSDDPVSSCTVCSEPVQRVFHPVAVHFKGSGFYTTDYGRNRSGAGDSTSPDSAKPDSKKDSKESKDSAATASDTKSDAKTKGSGGGSD